MRKRRLTADEAGPREQTDPGLIIQTRLDTGSLQDAYRLCSGITMIRPSEVFLKLECERLIPSLALEYCSFYSTILGDVNNKSINIH